MIDTHAGIVLACFFAVRHGIRLALSERAGISIILNNQHLGQEFSFQTFVSRRRPSGWQRAPSEHLPDGL
jgi:hypothetical protein